MIWEEVGVPIGRGGSITLCIALVCNILAQVAFCVVIQISFPMSGLDADDIALWRKYDGHDMHYTYLSTLWGDRSFGG